MIQQLLGARQIFEIFPSLKGRGKKKGALVTERLSFLFPLHSSKIMSTQANENMCNNMHSPLRQPDQKG
jgi:hypothetical protein